MENYKKKIIELLIKKYGNNGDVSDRGCFLNGKWFSLASIIETIENAEV